jgi:peptidoglycan/xylan/chitin deacetylase (PgdA/CDA1 family)
MWSHDRPAALSFSFDDARPSQVEVGSRTFEQVGVPATFFVLPHRAEPYRRRWRRMVAAGHEIGNHTTLHPCSGNLGWVDDGHAIEDLTVEDLAADIADADRWIGEVLGVHPRTFAYPCGQTWVGRGVDTRSYVPMIANRFLAGRAFNDISANSLHRCDLARLMCVNSDDKTFADLEPLLDATLAEGSWLVLGGHEIGDTRDFETTTPSLVEAVVDWCRRNGVWVDTIGTIAGYVLDRRRTPDRRVAVRDRRRVPRAPTVAPSDRGGETYPELAIPADSGDVAIPRVGEPAGGRS